MLFGQIPEEQIDIGVVELRGNEETHTFDPALIDKVMVHENSTRGFKNSGALSACLEVGFNAHIFQVYIFKEAEYLFGCPEYLQQTTGVVAFQRK